MDKKYVVYQHVTPDNMYYFGATSNIKRRWSRNGIQYKGTSLYPYIEKFGWDNIQHIVLFRDQSKEDALKIEDSLIISGWEKGNCINQQRSGHIRKEEGYFQQYYEENKQQILEQQKQYYETNKDKKMQYREQNKERIRKYQKQYREQNKEKKREQNKQYYEDNKQQMREQNKQYYEENRDKILEQKRQYYQRKKLEKQLKEVVETTLF